MDSVVISQRNIGVLAVCTDCPALAEGATAADLTSLLDEHHARTGHRLWAFSPPPPEGR